MPIIKRTYIALSTVILAAVVGLLIITIQYNWLFNNTSAWVTHTVAVQQENTRALASLRSYELGRSGLGSLEDHLQNIRRLTTDNGLQQARIDSLIRLIDAQPRIFLPDPDPPPHKSAIESIRDLILRMVDEEDRLLVWRQSANARSYRLQRDATISLLGLVFALLCISTWIILYNFKRRKTAEKDLVDSQQQTMKALLREKELNETKSRFVALASHEFKTPLSVILSSTNLIERYIGQGMEEQRSRHLRRIRSNVDNLKTLLNDFLSVERLEVGGVRNDPALTDTVKLSGEVIQDMEEACKEGQRFEIIVRGQRRPAIVDQHLLRNILNNLLSNAIKYSPNGSIIVLTLQFDDNIILIRVADNGIGIPAGEQEHLFERFFRATNTGGVSGTGLGLSIVKKYLDLMEGTIAVESRPGAGTTVTVSLPYRPTDRDPAQDLVPDAMPA
ncbi:MAG TPA: ATP-binding protein [Puia sp.]|nr:ATP-binding protein [Puia sp.]